MSTVCSCFLKLCSTVRFLEFSLFFARSLSFSRSLSLFLESNSFALYSDLTKSLVSKQWKAGQDGENMNSNFLLFKLFHYVYLIVWIRRCWPLLLSFFPFPVSTCFLLLSDWLSVISLNNGRVILFFESKNEGRSNNYNRQIIHILC